MIYSLTYELKSSDFDYSALFKFLDHGGDFNCIHVTRDCWWITPIEKMDIDFLVDKLRALMGPKDHFFVTALSSLDINGWLPSSSWTFYKDNIK